MTRLAELRDSFEGVVPSIIATTDQAGVPNISYLSHIHYIDDRHVALSNQFFSKTAANVQANGVAVVLVVDGRTGMQHILDLRFVRSEQSGPLFARLEAQLDVSTAGQGLRDIMRLRAVDIYTVEAFRPVIPSDPLVAAVAPEPPADRLPALAAILRRMAAETDAEAMLDTTLNGLASEFRMRNSVIVVPENQQRRLLAIASHGYEHFGFAAETGFEEGVIGTAASRSLVIRISDLGRANRYAAAVERRQVADPSTIPFPGLSNPRSQMAVPIMAGSELLGVLFVESAEAYAFSKADEDALSVVAAQLALGLRLTDVRSRPTSDPPVRPEAFQGNDAPAFDVSFDPYDGSIHLAGEYLIRGVPGRLLHHLLTRYQQSGQQEFTNRELRRDKSLRLPDGKDNLETRLILLRRRLEEKAAPVRLLREDRGRLRLTMTGRPVLAPSA